MISFSGLAKHLGGPPGGANHVTPTTGKGIGCPDYVPIKKVMVQAWQDTNVPPRMEMKKRIALRLDDPLTTGIKPVGIAPRSKRAIITLRGPKRSTKYPEKMRTTEVPERSQVAVCDLVGGQI